MFNTHLASSLHTYCTFPSIPSTHFFQNILHHYKSGTDLNVDIDTNEPHL